MHKIQIVDINLDILLVLYILLLLRSSDWKPRKFKAIEDRTRVLCARVLSLVYLGLLQSWHSLCLSAPLSLVSL